MLRKGFDPWPGSVNISKGTFFERVKGGMLMKILNMRKASKFTGYTINIGPIGFNFDWDPS